MIIQVMFFFHNMGIQDLPFHFAPFMDTLPDIIKNKWLLTIIGQQQLGWPLVFGVPVFAEYVLQGSHCINKFAMCIKSPLLIVSAALYQGGLLYL